MARARKCSWTRRRQLMQDRARTRAISAYLAHFRDSLAAELDVLPLDRNRRRKALEQKARLQFRGLPEEEQQKWLEKAACDEPTSAEDRKNMRKQDPKKMQKDTASAAGNPGGKARRAEAKTVPAKRARREQAAEASGPASPEDAGKGVRECSPAKLAAEASGPASPEGNGKGVRECSSARSHPTTPWRGQPPRTSTLARSLELSGTKVRHDRAAGASQTQPQLLLYASSRRHLGKATPTMEKLFGDAGAAEVQAASLRILRAILPELGQEKQSADVTAAVVAGVAAKLTQTATDPDHVKKLWAALAGRSRVALVVKLEPKVLNMWAVQSLDSEYWPRALLQ